ncbi:MAG: hypothetical protein IJO33_04190 [Bacilli bacterium]|nr:hypothetical protein [Bacilli bacterium]
MNKEIKLEDIEIYQNNYLADKNNVKIQKFIYTSGINETCFNYDLESKTKFDFNIEIPKVKMYNQRNSYECNIFAFLRVVKSIIKKENNFDANKLDISASYIDFYDKLEKINTAYNELFKEKNLTIPKISQIINRYIGIYGTFNYCKKIINKYGFVLSKDMPEVNSKYNAVQVNELLRHKIKADALCLINRNKDNDNTLKDDLINEAYIFLSKVLGNPPTKVKFGNKKITPLEFRNTILKDTLDDYVSVTTFSQNVLYSSDSFIPSVYLKDNEEIISINNEELKNAIIKQLIDGIGIWFSSEESTTLDYRANILDDHIYKYDKYLNIKPLSKDDKLLMDITSYDHAMCITGALVKNNKVKQFKADNSFGYHGKYKGKLIMTNSFLENQLIVAIINKKYLNR